MSAADPTAAERARRYRARQRDINPQLGSSAVLDLLQQLADDVHELRVAVDNRAHRDASRRPRDVTNRHAPTDDAPAPARPWVQSPSPTGSRALATSGRDAVTAFELGVQQSRILSLLDGRAPHTVAALADACDLSQQATIAALIELHGLGLVERIAGQDAQQRDTWQLRPAAPAPPDGQLGVFDPGVQA